MECPHCHFEFRSEDIAHTLQNENFKCPVCGGKIPSAPAVKNRFAQIVAGKQLHPAEIVASQSHLDQRKQDCENTFRELREFESEAILY